MESALESLLPFFVRPSSDDTDLQFKAGQLWLTKGIHPGRINFDSSRQALANKSAFQWANDKRHLLFLILDVFTLETELDVDIHSGEVRSSYSKLELTILLSDGRIGKLEIDPRKWIFDGWLYQDDSSQLL